MKPKIQKITPFIWFESGAEKAVEFYVSIFKNAKMKEVSHYKKVAEEVTGQKAGTVMTVCFELEGVEFLAINGGPQFKLNGAVSFVINCDTQEEIDYYWEKLGEGGQHLACGWVVDKFGMTWQVTPTIMGKIMMSDKEGSARAFAAMLEMTKLDIAKLEKAFEGK
jgi:predicted 3-demethylubiquinone-9 3-methyltransferase (glyoxalase superfamily)